ncbi:MAG TPA: 16S rRNA (guanine(966)-N(2))-methyltransferase RsmD [Syntrophorhabdaceae bacterium]|mgnify:FL=1|nr:16S rRNA (guanine(966)-N(2))-methyltransferase RsmD [Syntrophorhabdaceae bacterium]
MRKLKITGGILRGNVIKMEDHITGRHTASKVRESIFNMLGDISGKRVIDLFSGSGIIVFEAISRGASHGAFVEIDKKLIKNIEENINCLGIDGLCRVLHMDVFVAIPFLHKTEEIYDIIFMDPPYEKGYISKTFKALKDSIIYHRDSIFVVEHSKREMIKNNLSDSWGIIKEKRYGDTMVALINKIVH